MRDWFINLILRIKDSTVTNSDTLFNGTCPVANPIRIFSLIMNINTSSAPVFDFRYSVCPLKLNFSDWIFFLSMGAVIRIFIFPDFRSSNAFSSERNAASPPWVWISQAQPLYYHQDN